MRARVILFIAVGLLILLGSAAAEPCSSGSGKKCKCNPPLARVCGPKDDPDKKTCWCESRAGGGYGYGTGSYGKSEIHKKNVPQTHPTPAPRAADPNTSSRATPWRRHSAVRSARLSAMVACMGPASNASLREAHHG